MRIRLASTEDEPFIAELAATVFSAFGDYRSALPEWFRMTGVRTWLAEGDEGPSGYVMLAFFRDGEAALVGDVLALGVTAPYQHLGIGRMLLEHAISVCEQVGERLTVRAVRLSVAQDNERARKLFESCGFRKVEGEPGTYGAGQKALHLERPVAPNAVSRSESVRPERR